MYDSDLRSHRRHQTDEAKNGIHSMTSSKLGWGNIPYKDKRERHQSGVSQWFSDD